PRRCRQGLLHLRRGVGRAQLWLGPSSRPADYLASRHTPLFCSTSLPTDRSIPFLSLTSDTAVSEITAMITRYSETEAVVPVACSSAWAIVGAKAPPMTAPRAYEIATPLNRTDAGKSST